MNDNYPILTAQEFIDQGTTAGAVLSIAAYNENLGKRECATSLSLIARQVAQQTGQRLRIPGSVNDNKRRRVA